MELGSGLVLGGRTKTTQGGGALAAPVFSTAPVISGDAPAGSLLTVSAGAVTGNPIPTRTYQWKADGTNISGATGVTYTTVTGDFGKAITCTETATNTQGNASSTSNSITVTAALAAPVFTVATTISGATPLGSVLTVTPGTVTGNPTPTVARQWKADGTNIAGATGTTYTSVSGDIGKAITCVETATNSQGNSSSVSNSITVTPALAAPTFSVAPVISGASLNGSVLTVTPGTVAGVPTPSVAHQWQADGTNISGQTGTTYTTVTGDVGKAITCIETATNSQGNASSTSNAITVTSVPAFTVAPVISGSSTAGQVLTVAPGTVTGNPTPSVARQWKADGTNISGQTGTTYTTVTGDIGKAITCTETASNSQGSTPSTSNGITVVSVATAEVVAWRARLGTPVGDPWAAAVAAFANALSPGTLSGTDIWAKMDVVVVPASSSDNWINVKQSGPTVSVHGGAPVFNGAIGFGGYTFDGVDDSVDTGFNPATFSGRKIAQNSGHFSIWMTTAATVAASPFGWVTTQGTNVNPRTTGNIIGFRINQTNSSSTGAVITDASGQTTIARTASGTTACYKNGSAVTVTGAANQASLAHVSANYLLGTASDATWGAGTMAGYTIGSGLNANEAADLYNASLTLRQAFDNAVPSFVGGVPTIAGSYLPGQILTCTDAPAYGYPAATITRQWTRNGSNISGQTASTLDTTGFSAGDAIRVVETATNTNGSASATSAAFVLAAALTITPITIDTTASSGTTLTLTLTAAVAAGETIVVLASQATATVSFGASACADSKGNTWLRRISDGTTSPSRTAAIFECLAPVAMIIGDTITLTSSGTISSANAIAYKLGRGAVFDQSVGIAGPGASATTWSLALPSNVAAGGVAFIEWALSSGSITVSAETGTITVTQVTVNSRKHAYGSKTFAAAAAASYGNTLSPSTNVAVAMASYI